MIPQPGLCPVAPLPSLGGGRRESEQPSSSGHRYDPVIAGMVEKGLGLAAISTILAQSPEWILERVVALALPTPHDRPMRRSTHPKAWPISDILLMIECWLDGWDPGSMAALFERSKGSIYGLRRRLNLPRRQRKDVRLPGGDKFTRRRRERLQASEPDVLRPSSHGETLSPRPVAITPPSCSAGPAIPPPEPKAVPSRPACPEPYSPHSDLVFFGPKLQLAPMPLAPESHGAKTLHIVDQPDGSQLRIEHKENRPNEIHWSFWLDLNISFRAFAGQRYQNIAADLKLTPASVRSRLCRLEVLKGEPRSEPVEHFDPELALLRIRELDRVFRKRRGPSATGWIWGRRRERKFGDDIKKSKAYRDAAAVDTYGCSVAF